MSVADARSTLHRTLAPRSVAVVGASRDRDKLGGKVLANLEARFDGEIYAVNPRGPHGERQDATRWVANLGELPDGMDLAILAVPEAAVSRLLAEGPLAKGLGGLAVLAEPSGDAAARRRFERQLTDYAANTATRVLGPNSSGFRAYRDGTFATFAGDVDARITGASALGSALAGPVSLISQSGAMMAYLGGTVLRGRNVELDYVVDTGNEADISAAECLAFLAERGARRVGLVLEGTRDWRHFRDRLAKAVAAGVVVVALQVGRSSAGQAISATHTGAVGGSAGAFRAVVEAAGAIVAEDEAAFLDALTVDPTLVAGRRPEVFLGGFSGGMNALIVDQLSDNGFSLVEPPSDFGPAALRDVGPIQEVLRRAASNPAAAASIVFTGHVTQMASVGARVFDVIATEAHACNQAVIVIGRPPETPLKPAPGNVVVVDVPSSAVRALAIAGRVAGLAVGPDNTESAGAAGPSAAPVRPSTTATAQSAPTQVPPAQALPAQSLSAQALPWTDAQATLTAAGVAVPATRVVAGAEAAAEAGAQIGFPVVLKADAPALLHRARHGLVRVGVADREAAAEEYHRLLRRSAELGLADAVVLVQAMVPIELELFVGVQLVDAFGPTIILSLGGSGVEAGNRARIQLPVPLTPQAAREALRRLGVEPAGVLAGTVIAIGDAALDQVGASVVEVNPLCVSERYPAGVAVDCVILRRASVY